jgi:drug/metabolite transporter (DMT)-like permease
MSDLQFGELAALATAVFWTLSALAWTFTAERIGAMAVCFIRLIMAAVMLILYERLARGLWWPSDASLRDWCLLGGSGIAGYLLSDLCLFKAFVLLGTRRSLLIGALTPPITAVTSWLYIGDVLSLRHWLAMGVTLAGVVWVLLEEPNHDTPPEAQPRWRGIVLAVLSAILAAFAYVLSKEGLANYNQPVAATLIRALVALPGYVVFVTLGRRWLAMRAALSHASAMGVLVLGTIVGPVIGVICNLVALQYAPTGVVATIIATMPVLILPFSIVLHREKVSLRAAGGAVMAVAGVAMLML